MLGRNFKDHVEILPLTAHLYICVKCIIMDFY